MSCEYCERPSESAMCSACLLYNAAVCAQQKAAIAIAIERAPKVTDAWLNEYGVFARTDGIVRQVASKEEAAPFAALTTAALRAGEIVESLPAPSLGLSGGEK